MAIIVVYGVCKLHAMQAEYDSRCPPSKDKDKDKDKQPTVRSPYWCCVACRLMLACE